MEQVIAKAIGHLRINIKYVITFLLPLYYICPVEMSLLVVPAVILLRSMTCPMSPVSCNGTIPVHSNGIAPVHCNGLCHVHCNGLIHVHYNGTVHIDYNGSLHVQCNGSTRVQCNW